MIVIGISGGTGSGKTHLAKHLIDYLARQGIQAGYLAQDRYYHDLSHLSLDERYQTNFDHPDSADLELYADHIRRLRAGQSIDAPIFDYVRCVRQASPDTISPTDVLIVEGLFILTHQPVRDLIDIPVYLHVPDDIRLVRRIRRDVLGYDIDLEHVLTYYCSTVRPMHDQYIAPGAIYARLTLRYWKDADEDHALSALANAIKSAQIEK